MRIETMEHRSLSLFLQRIDFVQHKIGRFLYNENCNKICLRRNESEKNKTLENSCH